MAPLPSRQGLARRVANADACRHQLSSEVTTCPGPTHSFSPGESSPAGKAELTGPHFSLLMTAQARMALGVSRMDVAHQDSVLRHKPGFSWGNRGAYRGSRWAPLDPRVGSPASGPEARKNPHPPRWFPHPTLCPLQSVLFPPRTRAVSRDSRISIHFPIGPLGSPRVAPEVSFVLISNRTALAQSPPGVTARSSGPKWALRSSRLWPDWLC